MEGGFACFACFALYASDRGELTLEVNGVVQNRASWCEVQPGKLCLQSEGAYVEFRNIVLRPILN